MKLLRIVSMTALSVVLCSSLAFAKEMNMVFDFCGMDNHGRILEVKKDKKAGVEYAYKIEIPYKNVAEPTTIGVMIRNMGPGPITYLFEEETGLGAWSVGGKGLRTKYRLKKRIAKAERRIGRIEDKKGRIEDRAGRIEDKLAKVEGSLAEAKNDRRHKRLTKRQERLTKKQERLTSWQERLTEGIDRMQERFNSLFPDVEKGEFTELQVNPLRGNRKRWDGLKGWQGFKRWHRRTGAEVTPQTVEFSDGGWGGTQYELHEWTGCTKFQAYNLPLGEGKVALGLSFFRDGKLYNVPVKFIFR